MNQILKAKAPAKVNLALDIIGKRIDGYHDLRMINHSVTLADELELIPSTIYDIKSNLTDIPVDQNLITKALVYLSTILKKPLDFQINLKKNIPMQAGLGGGSSDAAAAIKLALEHWQTPLDPKILNSFALKVSSDVPYSLYNQAALVEGLGEKLNFIHLEKKPKILIVHPDIAISTQEAYRAVSSSDTIYHPKISESVKRLQKGEFQSLREVAGNSFTPVIAKKYPEIEEIIEKLYTLGADYVTMSGSGSTIVSYFEDEEKLKNAQKDLKDYKTTYTEFL